MPVAFKDLTDVAGVVTTHGSAALDHKPALADGALAAALKGAGVVSLGKTQVPEFGLTAYSENRIAPPSRNPYALSRSSGGSSGGSAAAVAAGLVPFAPGSDGGGSVRIPAAACGLVGLKPGRGLVPAGESTGDPAGLVVAGPLARSAADAALLLDALVPGAGTEKSAAPAPGYRELAAQDPPGSGSESAWTARGRRSSPSRRTPKRSTPSPKASGCLKRPVTRPRKPPSATTTATRRRSPRPGPPASGAPGSLPSARRS